MVQLFAVFALVILGTGSLAQLTKEKVLEAVKSCCSVENYGCCKNALDFLNPITCGDDLANKNMTICLHDALHPEEKSIEDYQMCCDSVFGDDLNDTEEHCRRMCRKITTRVFLYKSEKLRYLKSCKFENPLYKCFIGCLNTKEFVFNAHLDCFQADKFPANRMRFVPKR